MTARVTRNKPKTKSRRVTRVEPRSAKDQSDLEDAVAMIAAQRNRIFVKEAVNLNTVVAIIGFLSVFAGLVVTWSNVQFKQTALDNWEKDHTDLHARLDSDRAATRAAIYTRLNTVDQDNQKQATDLEQLKYQLAQIGKEQDALTARQDRMSESYGNQFTEMRAVLSNLSTQLALANSSLARLEKADTKTSDHK